MRDDRVSDLSQLVEVVGLVVRLERVLVHRCQVVDAQVKRALGELVIHQLVDLVFAVCERAYWNVLHQFDIGIGQCAPRDGWTRRKGEELDVVFCIE